jgi:renalase
MEPGSLFSLMVAFPQELGVGAGAGAGAGAAGFDAAVVVGSEVVQLLVRNTSKPGRSGGGRSRAGDGLECWVAISTKAFAEKVVAGAPLSVNGEYNPQTAAYLEAVTPTMVAEVRRLLRESREEGGKGLDVPELVHAKSQRWGNAFPMTTTMLGGGGGGGGGGGSRGGFIWDGASGFAACGDFVVGAGVEAAFLSGLGAGAAIAEALSSSDC